MQGISQRTADVARASATVLLSILLVLVVSPASRATQPEGVGNPNNGVTKIGICHATNSDSNPYLYRSVDDDATSYEGHKAHRDDPNQIKTWKRAGTWNGVTHAAGAPKPDLIGVQLDGQTPITEAYCNEPTTGGPSPADLRIDKVLDGSGTPDPSTGFSFTVVCDGETVTATVAANAATNWSWNDDSGELAVDADSTCSIIETTPRGNAGVSVTFNGASADEGTSYGLVAGTNTFVVTNTYRQDGGGTSGVSIAKFVAEGSTAPTADCGDSPWAASVSVTTGATIQWCLKVVNTGDDALNSVAVVDEIGDSTPDEAAGCTLPNSLAIDGEDECTYATTADADGTYTNYAAVSATGAVSGSNVTGTASAAYTASAENQTYGIAIAKYVALVDEPTACGPDVDADDWGETVEVAVGDDVLWCVVVENKSDRGALSQVDIEDALTAGAPVAADFADIVCDDIDGKQNKAPNALAAPPSDNSFFVCTYTTTAVAGGQTNTAQATSMQAGPVSDAAAYTIGAATLTSDVSIAKYVARVAAPSACGTGTATSSDWGNTVSVAVGATVVWCVVVENTGETELTSLELKDALTAGAPDGTTTYADLVCDSPTGALPTTLAVDAVFACQYDTVAVAGGRTNTATVDSAQTLLKSDNAAYTISTIITGGDPDPEVEGEVIVRRNPGIDLEKSADAEEYSVGDTITYTYVITNTGDTTLTAIALEDDVLGNLTPELSTRTLLPGDSVTVTVTQEALLDHIPSLTNVAVASGVSPGDGRISDTDDETVDVSAVLGIVIDNPPAPAPEPQAPEPAPQAAPVEVAGEHLPRTGSDPLPVTAVALLMMALGSLLLGRFRPE